MKWRTFAAGLYVGAVAVFVFLPVVVLVQYSFQDGLTPVPPFRGFSLRWYEKLFANRKVLEALWHSLAVGVAAAATATVLGFLAAWGLARGDSRHVAGKRLLLMAPVTVSYLIIGMGLLATFSLLDVQKSLIAVTLGHVIINLPVAFAIIYSQLGEHQHNIERAARDLGASDAQVLLHVTAPLLWPALAAAFFIAFTLSWDEFVIAFLLSRFDVTLPVVMWSMLRTGLNPELNAVGSFVFAISVVLVILVEWLFAGSRRRA